MLLTSHAHREHLPRGQGHPADVNAGGHSSTGPAVPPELNLDNNHCGISRAPSGCHRPKYNGSPLTVETLARGTTRFSEPRAAAPSTKSRMFHKDHRRGEPNYLIRSQCILVGIRLGFLCDAQPCGVSKASLFRNRESEQTKPVFVS